MSSRVFLVSVLLPFLLFLARTYSNHMYVGSSLEFGHITWRIWEISHKFLLPATQLITKCKRRAKLNGKIKRSKRSHLYYSNSVVRDRLVLAGDVETNPGPNDAKTGRKKSVQNIAVKKSCLACNKTIRLNQKELTCNLCSGSFHYKCEAGKLKLDVNLGNCTRCGLPPLSDSFFDLDTALNRSRRSSQYDDLEDNDSDSLD